MTELIIDEILKMAVFKSDLERQMAAKMQLKDMKGVHKAELQRDNKGKVYVLVTLKSKSAKIPKELYGVEIKIK